MKGVTLEFLTLGFDVGLLVTQIVGVSGLWVLGLSCNLIADMRLFGN